MTRCDRVVGVIGALRTAENMLPQGSDRVSGRNIYNFGGYRRGDTGVADEILRCHVLDWLLDR